jgi:hypothetical protein
MTDLEHCLAILKALQIEEVSYCLSGGGDSGTVDVNGVLYADGHLGVMPTVTVGITDGGDLVTLAERLENLVYDLPDGDWINNEGGYGNVYLRPQKLDPGLQVECDMTWGDDNDEPDFEDEEESEEPDFKDPNPGASDQPLAIDDSALQPAKGDNP